MSAHVGTPEGAKGTIDFDGMDQPRPAVRTEDGRYYVQTVNPNLWLPAQIRPEQFQTV